jgi:hypothetical protein
MIAIEVRYDGTEALRQAFAQAPDMARDEMFATVERLVKRLAVIAQNRWPRDSGASAGSIYSVTHHTSVGVLGEAVSAKPEVAFIELGTRPHWAPLEPLIEWVSRRPEFAGKDHVHIAKLIQYRIARHGTKARLIFAQVLRDNDAAIKGLLNNAAIRLTRRLAAEGGAA